LIAVLLSAATAGAGIDIVQEHVFDASPGQRVLIDVSFHRVEVVVEPGSQVHAVVELSSSSSSRKAEKAMEELAPVFQKKGNSLVIRSTRKGGWSSWWGGNIKGLVRVTMPPDLDLSVDSSSGSISIDGDFGSGSVVCDASSGSIEIRGAMKNLSVDTSSGSTKALLTRPVQSFFADASSGSIRLSGGADEAKVDTSSGSITVDGLRGDAHLGASSGSISAQWDSIPPRATIDADASSGSVTIKLPPGTEVTGSASTSSGGIRSDFPGSYGKKSATFSGGPDGIRVSISTSSGGVRVVEG
jgi:hypothetical protein